MNQSLPLVLDQIARHQTQRPHDVALSDENRQISWKELACASNAIANALLARGCGRGDTVAILAENSIEYVQILLGILKAGACAVPLSTLLSNVILRNLLNDAAPSVVFASRDYSELMESALQGFGRQPPPLQIQINHDSQGWICLRGFVRGQPLTIPDVTIHGNELFNIIYSSGTTGVPKGIEHDHLFRAWQCDNAPRLFDLGKNSVGVFPLPLYSNASLAALFPFLATGARILLTRKFEEEQFLEICVNRNPTHVFLVPAMLQRLLAWPDLHNYELSPNVIKWVGTAPFSEEYKRRVLALWPGPFMETYGMTEGGPMFSLRVHEHLDKLRSVGQPFGGTEVLILDGQDNKCGPNETGEIVGRSPTMMRGYHGRQDLTEQVLYRDAVGRTYLRTGDLGHIDEDGFLYLAGRKKDMLISGGFNIYPTDIESIMLTHDDVIDVAVIGAASERWGESPFAFVVRQSDCDTSIDEIISWTNARVAKYQRLAGAEFCEDLPRNSLGKVLKRDLREAFHRRHGTLA